MLDRLADPQQGARTFCLFLVTHLLVWTVYSSVTQANLDKWGDMAENFAWGQEWQLGYHHHPPLFAWITALWFKVFPTVDWTYFILSQINVIIGFVAIWFLVKMFLSERHALIAVVLLELVPFYTFLSFKFNANAILLSLWPLTALCFCHAYATRRFAPSPLVRGFGRSCSLVKILFILLIGSIVFDFYPVQRTQAILHECFALYIGSCACGCLGSARLLAFQRRVLTYPLRGKSHYPESVSNHDKNGNFRGGPTPVFTTHGAGLRGDRRRTRHSTTTTAQP